MHDHDGWDNAGTRNSIQGSHVGDRNPTTSNITQLLEQEARIRSERGIEHSYCDVGHWYPNQAKHPPILTC